MKFDIDFFSTVSILAPTIIGAIFYQRFSKPLKTLSQFIFTTFLLELAARVLYEYGQNNMFIFHVYTFIEYGFIAAVYYQLFITPNKKRIVISFSGIFMVFSMLNIFMTDVYAFNSVQRHLEAVFLVVFFLMYIVELDKIDKTRLSFKNPYFVLTAGLMVYFFGTLFLFVLGRKVLGGDDGSMWVIHGILNILLNLVYSIVLIMGIRKKSRA